MFVDLNFEVTPWIVFRGD